MINKLCSVLLMVGMFSLVLLQVADAATYSCYSEGLGCPLPGAGSVSNSKYCGGQCGGDTMCCENA